MTAITAITAQNTVGVEAVEAIPPEMIVAQVRAVAEDIGVDAVKIGMLGTAATVEAVVEALGLLGDAPVVIDPVMVAESGAVLLDPRRPAGADRAAAAADDRGDAEHPRGAGADRAGARRRPRRSWPAAVLALGPRRSSSPAATARTGRPLLRRRAAGRDPRRAPPRRRRPRLRLHPLLGAGRLPRPWRRAAGGGPRRPPESPPPRSPTDCARSATARPGRRLRPGGSYRSACSARIVQ